jgi:hypothetical protein
MSPLGTPSPTSCRGEGTVGTGLRAKSIHLYVSSLRPSRPRQRFREPWHRRRQAPRHAHTPHPPAPRQHLVDGRLIPPGQRSSRTFIPSNRAAAGIGYEASGSRNRRLSLASAGSRKKQRLDARRRASQDSPALCAGSRVVARSGRPRRRPLQEADLVDDFPRWSDLGTSCRGRLRGRTWFARHRLPRAERGAELCSAPSRATRPHQWQRGSIIVERDPACAPLIQGLGSARPASPSPPPRSTAAAGPRRSRSPRSPRIRSSPAAPAPSSAAAAPRSAGIPACYRRASSPGGACGRPLMKRLSRCPAPSRAASSDRSPSCVSSFRRLQSASKGVDPTDARTKACHDSAVCRHPSTRAAGRGRPAVAGEDARTTPPFDVAPLPTHLPSPRKSILPCSTRRHA